MAIVLAFVWTMVEFGSSAAAAIESLTFSFSNFIPSTNRSFKKMRNKFCCDVNCSASSPVRLQLCLICSSNHHHTLSIPQSKAIVQSPHLLAAFFSIHRHIRMTTIGIDEHDIHNTVIQQAIQIPESREPATRSTD
jgi:hypothetical protein